jgi:SOS response regulatory protein OraA/RecX
VAAVIARLTACRYLDDAEFARAWVTARAHRVAVGPARLARESKGSRTADRGGVAHLAEE